MPSHWGCVCAVWLMILLARWIASRSTIVWPHVAARRLDLVAFFGAFAGLGHELDDGLDRDAARDLAGVVTAHAVGEHPEADFRLRADRVLVVISDLADVADLDVDEFTFEAHARVIAGSPLAQAACAALRRAEAISAPD